MTCGSAAFAGGNLLDTCFIGPVQRWIERFVVGHNLCPFARRELERGAVRYIVSPATQEEGLLDSLLEELELLESDARVETTFLIHPHVLQDFFDFNQFLGRCDRLLTLQGLEGVYQVASFHPRYQFAGTQPDDAENYSNRSPFPMLHILREDSVERAIASYPGVEDVPARNVALLNELGKERLLMEWEACFRGL